MPSKRRGSATCSRRWSGARPSPNTCWTPWKSQTPISIIIVTIYKNNLFSYHLLNKIIYNLKIDCRKSPRALSTISKDGGCQTLTVY